MNREDHKFIPFFFTLAVFLGIFFIVDSAFTSSTSISFDKDRIVSSEVGFTSYSPRGISGGAIVPASAELTCEELGNCPVKTCEELGNCPVKTCEELGNCPVKTCEELGNCPVKTCEELGNCPVKTCEELGNCPVKTCEELGNCPVKTCEELGNCPVKTCEELGNCPPKTCEELGNCPPKTCEELGNCPPKTCEELGNCPPPWWDPCVWAPWWCSPPPPPSPAPEPEPPSDPEPPAPPASPPSSFNYSLSNSGTSFVTKTSGNAFTQNTITKSLTAGGTQSVTLSLTGQPSGVTYSVASSACSPTCTSVITFTVAPTAVNGTYPITVTGTPLNRQTAFNLVISGNPMTATCSASPGTALLGQTVTWTAIVSGGTSPKTYVWSGTNIPTSPAPTTNPYSITYGTIGQKSASVTVTDANNLHATCPTATAQINFNPLLEEF